MTRFPAVDGTPVGDASAVICDACNRMIARQPYSDERRASDVTRGEAVLFLTRAAGRWSVRFVSCPSCGPCGDPDFMATDEATAICGVEFERRRTRFVVAKAEQHPTLPHRGDRPRLTGE